MNTSVLVPAGLPPLAMQTTAEHPWPLRLLSAKIHEYIARMPGCWVEGEIVEFTPRPGAKVQFFKLADLQEKASIPVKIFSSGLPKDITAGARVVVLAKPDYWEVNGSFALFAREVRPVGLGDLLARIAELKQRLAAEGLFAPERKLPLPFLPRRIGLICGRNAKAKHDVLVNATARWPSAQFVIREVAVQGKSCAAEVTAALQELDAQEEVEVIIITRGGGSVEDLLPFSEEMLVRAATQAHTPIISAIGHETDNPLLDYVADVRASTPTDAARRVVPDVTEETEKIQTALAAGRQLMENQLARAENEQLLLRSHPILQDPLQTLLVPRAEHLENLLFRIRTSCEHILTKENAQIGAELAKLRTLSPSSTLKRGYSILQKDSGEILCRQAEAIPDMHIAALLYDGKISLSVLADEES